MENDIKAGCLACRRMYELVDRIENMELIYWMGRILDDIKINLCDFVIKQTKRNFLGLSKALICTFLVATFGKYPNYTQNVINRPKK